LLPPFEDDVEVIPEAERRLSGLDAFDLQAPHTDQRRKWLFLFQVAKSQCVFPSKALGCGSCRKFAEDARSATFRRAVHFFTDDRFGKPHSGIVAAVTVVTIGTFKTCFLQSRQRWSIYKFYELWDFSLESAKGLHF